VISRLIPTTLVLLLTLILGYGCSGPVHYIYAGNVKIAEKGIAQKDWPKGLASGTLWAKAAGGYIRFQDSQSWKKLVIGKYYVIHFDSRGWVQSVVSSAEEREFVILGD
jgi:hypothetical protein